MSRNLQLILGGAQEKRNDTSHHHMFNVLLHYFTTEAENKRKGVIYCFEMTDGDFHAVAIHSLSLWSIHCHSQSLR